MMGKINRLILALTFIVSCAFAQASVPAWLNQIKLTGLSGSVDHRLALINDKTFSTGEENDLKLKGRTVHVQCLEIREQSVLVKIQDLPSPYELTMSGNIIALEDNPVASKSPPQSTVRIERSAPSSVPPINLFTFNQPTSQPSVKGNVTSFGTILIFAGILLALLVGIAIGTGAAQSLHRKNVGEAMLADAISRYFSRAHLLLNNVTLPIADGTTQIDHILVADTGVFVIETKHYSGWIFGNPQEKQWTQTIYRKKSRFQNPLHQNYGHVKALRSLFDLPEDHFHSVVVFTAEAEFKTDLGPNVVRLADLIPFLAAKRPVVFDERKMAYVVGRIEMKRERRSVETDEYHINHLRSRHDGQILKPATQVAFAPQCSDPLARDSGDKKYRPKA